MDTVAVDQMTEVKSTSSDKCHLINYGQDIPGNSWKRLRGNALRQLSAEQVAGKASR